MPRSSNSRGLQQQSLCSRILLGLTLCRIFPYLCFHRVCCGKRSQKSREQAINILCLGLNGAGKSWLSDILANHTHLVAQPPTNGFVIKTIQLNTNTVINVKELGGSDSIRPYWSKYYDQNYQALFYIIDTSKTSSSIEVIEDSIHQLNLVLSDATLSNIPCLVFLNHHHAPLVSVKEVEVMSGYKSLLSETGRCGGTGAYIEVAEVPDGESVAPELRLLVANWLHTHCKREIDD